ncbi:UDP-3-O-[3-hydroxymyristoyl] N-acetylglucosamine deacetylase/3-hydroxyacyl-[acyl-carrier-protein] dehydratase [Parabacteroides sp. PF5-5]|uniref:UDP-3-O-acyl-N-acetylglucosamine deacetylase n=1 Tax=unclassified Parabacteroides TaxID=2649774 RepID=UPI0024759C56|nr:MULTISPECIES: UDP-3-O-acyl-N-acetylglucosamine deacetylase [unclassified Parabacteroides]MDH6304876.1 UDP-3-O-[3-hydroxymyristoyl] N-acetylglucosamine deacetylase/3-hydroxyacyl-[acyl-carrier-protein] dehydratase [Parabacteroides sp. PH5-39]MDH6316038.1 UDP-3-O-[3-hydroxymyristoyl] N-acetylglucosamine deacetylase/3-hydroxyacyl-[acyl-carrier-protein] dehydratase [Parabacteroides sp. PF5-13]MDH6319695.1 UDP-3-O-[3-hydroxymyristoyl] N-acetylglucosamine deacetylase/3-hydroxyacyl-[acyl-carrier-prot
MEKQRTLKSSFSLEGKGLHTGVYTKITFHPAPENHGYKIRRTDILGKPLIEALTENVVNTQRSTTLSNRGVRVSTVEHALAALYGCEIDNCLIDIDGPEFPILDGSAKIYVANIKEAGIRFQNAEREYIRFNHKRIQVKDEETGSSLLLLPSDTFSIQVKIAFDSEILDMQYASLTNLTHFALETAPARTFVFVKEIRLLVEKNLIKGGDLDNAIVIYDTPMSQDEFNKLAGLTGLKHKDANNLGYIMNEPLQYINEPARHKLLDVLGDLALTGGFIKGTVIANCPGHTINTRFAQLIRDKHLYEEQKKSVLKYVV